MINPHYYAKLMGLKNHFEMQLARLNKNMAPSLYDSLTQMYERLSSDVDEIEKEMRRLSKHAPVDVPPPAIRLDG